ncbi:glycosyltransferase family 2 protein [Subtercola lobariae]|uniref:Glycosyl transferase family A n=1 Tax=Subtercola lobariae TaxID=1588641 RepID=A0A917F0X6_9MICO|nr:galactosyltransferase-related protein [Subtercola lobariae]GGF41330.1 glycosyl transferase family A [Subtercola lobariae]
MNGPAVVTLVSAARLDHAQAQWARTAEIEGLRQVTVWLDEKSPPRLPGTVIHLPPGANGLRLAVGRNVGAQAAIDGGADLLVFLDADCLPGNNLIERYCTASREHSEAMLCGPVTYLPEEFVGTTPADLERATKPHSARPNPTDTRCELAPADDYRLFWSLSFAVTAPTWRRSGGFSELYEGYGGEDTDFAATLLERTIPLVWVGGAHAYHQYHPTQAPPWQHLDDIVRNASIFHSRWGSWPMEGWLNAFAKAGAIRFADGGWMRVT